MNSDNMMYTALRSIANSGEEEIPLAPGLLLIRPNEQLLAHRWKWVMNEQEFAEEATASRYLMCRYPAWIPDGDAEAEGSAKFYSGLMAIQIIKPVQTLGFVHSRQLIERRPPMEAGSWARMTDFDPEMLKRVPPLIQRIQRVMRGDSTERKNAITLLQLGLEQSHPYVAGLLWLMGLESIFDSRDRKEFKRRLCDCLGPHTLAFPDWNRPLSPPPYTVEHIAVLFFTLRNKLTRTVDLRRATSDKNFPLDLTPNVKLTAYSEPTPYTGILCQASCYLLCHVLQQVI
jgi:hypothetical protein